MLSSGKCMVAGTDFLKHRQCLFIVLLECSSFDLLDGIPAYCCFRCVPINSRVCSEMLRQGLPPNGHSVMLCPRKIGQEIQSSFDIVGIGIAVPADHRSASVMQGEVEGDDIAVLHQRDIPRRPNVVLIPSQCRTFIVIPCSQCCCKFTDSFQSAPPRTDNSCSILWNSNRRMLSVDHDLELRV